MENQFNHDYNYVLIHEEKTTEALDKILQTKLKFTILLSIFLALFALSTSLFSANATSIVMENYYPDDRGTYEFVNHFIEQTTAVNTNTTVSVSIDGGALIPMMYQGIKNEIAPSDIVARDWYTWTITVPAITAPGKHTFQFFRHYYVWQEADQYWAEFNSYSDVRTFTIANSSAMPSPSPLPTTMNSDYIFAIIATSAITAFLVLVMVTLRKNTQQHGRAA